MFFIMVKHLCSIDVFRFEFFSVFINVLEMGSSNETTVLTTNVKEFKVMKTEIGYRNLQLDMISNTLIHFVRHFINNYISRITSESKMELSRRVLSVSPEVIVNTQNTYFTSMRVLKTILSNSQESKKNVSIGVRYCAEVHSTVASWMLPILKLWSSLISEGECKIQERLVG